MNDALFLQALSWVFPIVFLLISVLSGILFSKESANICKHIGVKAGIHTKRNWFLLGFFLWIFLLPIGYSCQLELS